MNEHYKPIQIEKIIEFRKNSILFSLFFSFNCLLKLRNTNTKNPMSKELHTNRQQPANDKAAALRHMEMTWNERKRESAHKMPMLLLSPFYIHTAYKSMIFIFHGVRVGWEIFLKILDTCRWHAYGMTVISIYLALSMPQF